MPEDPSDKIVRLMKETAPKRRRASSKPTPAPNVISISGNGNITAGGDIHMAPPPRPRVTPKTADGTIDAAEKAEIMRLMKRWLDTRNAIRRSTMSPGAGWKAFNDAMDVNSYHELKPDKMPAARDWFKRQTAILRSMKSAPTKIEDFRATMIQAIKARSRQLGDLHFYKPHIVRTYGADSLTQMSDRQLQELRAWIFNQRR